MEMVDYTASQPDYADGPSKRNAEDASLSSGDMERPNTFRPRLLKNTSGKK